MKNRSWKKIILGLSAVGPGLFLIGYNIGTGSVTTMAKVGAEYGMTLTWALAFSALFTFILMVAYGKLTLVTGHTALYTIRHQFRYGSILAIYIMIALITGELFSLMGIMGIVSELLSEGTALLGKGTGISPFMITLVLVIGLYLLLWVGQYRIFEKILIFFVILMGLSFIVVFFMVHPDFREILKGMIPGIPDQPGAFALVAAIAGTTCSAAVFIMRSTVVAEKGWSVNDLKHEKKDAAVSASTMFLLSLVIMAVAAGTLHVMGLKLNNTVEMISLLQPLGGKAAAFILILGIAGAGISTIFPIILIAPRLISDFTGKPRNIHSPMYRILGFAGILFGFGSLLVKATPPMIMVMSQAFQALILPAVSIPVIFLINRKKLVNKQTAGTLMNTGLVLVILFSLVTGYFAIIGLFHP